MKPVLSVVLMSLAFVACSDPTDSSALLIPAVRVGDAYYTIAEEPIVSERSEGALVATVTRLVACSDGKWLNDSTHVSDLCPLEDRESNFLAAGTPLFAVSGAAEEVLIAHRTTADVTERVLLQRVETY
jgi:hypothetical protein